MSAKMYRFDLSKKSGVSCQSFVIKETDGADEEIASESKQTRGAGATVFGELVRQSIVYVDDEKVEQPFDDYDRWTSKTRAYVLQAFQKINSVDDADMQGFLEAGVPFGGSKTPAPAVEPSGASG